MLKPVLFICLAAMFEWQICSQTNSLFSSDSVLKISIAYSSKQLDKFRYDKSKFQNSKLSLQIDSNRFHEFPVELGTRGIFRLKKNNCYFPPLQIKFSPSDIKNSLFDGNPRLKMVFPCNKSDVYEQYVLLEYLAYKIYTLLTEYSFKVRLLKIKLIDTDEKNTSYDKYGFFIESSHSLEKRTKSKEMEVKNLHPDLTDYQLINILSIFQYMIGNTDWSVRALHNIKLFARDSLKKPVAVPYDFDFSGLVNAPYALPAEQLNISSVKQRYFNGYQRDMNEIISNIQIFVKKKSEIYLMVRTIEGLEKQYIDETIKYFDQFYLILDDHEKIKQEFFEKCRKD